MLNSDKGLIWKIQADYVVYMTPVKLGILSYSEYIIYNNIVILLYTQI